MRCTAMLLLPSFLGVAVGDGTCSAFADMFAHGGNDVSHQTTSTAAACATLCSQTTGCCVAEFSKASVCYLKTKDAGALRPLNPGSGISGINCTGPCATAPSPAPGPAPTPPPPSPPAPPGPKPKGYDPKVKSVHVVYMSHLDLGFTSDTRSVCSQYFNILFPKARNLTRDLKAKGGPAKFRWTEFPWLLQEFLDGHANCAWGGDGDKTNRTAEAIAALEEDIKNDDMIWHATAVDFFPEILDEDMWDYSFTMKEKLNKKYGKDWGRKVGFHADVPGMSRAAIPAAVKHGLKAYHIGYNPACTKQLATLPQVFRWRMNETGEELLMMLDPFYGTTDVVNETGGDSGTATTVHRSTVPGAEEVALVFHFTLDNAIKGFPTVEDIETFWADTQQKFPNAELKLTSMDDFIEEVLQKGDVKALELVTGEIGDSWLYGVPADPIKVATFREARRVLKEALAAGKIDPSSTEYDRYMRRLIKGPAEHNWGIDTNRMDVTWNNTELHKDGGLGKRSNWEWAGWRGDWYSGMEGEWASQREWVYPCTPSTAGQLNHTCIAHPDKNNTPVYHAGCYKTWDKKASPSTPQWDAFVSTLMPRLDALAHPKPPQPSPSAKTLTPQQLDSMQPATCGGVRVAFSGADGSMRHLEDTKTTRVWVGGPLGNGTQRLAQFHYRTYDTSDCGLFGNEYCGLTCKTKGNTSLGSPPVSKRWAPKLSRATMASTAGGGCEYIMELGMDSEPHAVYGAPSGLSIQYTFPGTNGSVADVSLVWTNKPPTGLPESMWLSFVPEVAADAGAAWAMDVMGHPIDPLEVVPGGTRHVHAVDSGVTVNAGGRSLRIETLDSPIVCPGDANHLLRYVDDQPDVIKGGMHFVLESNIWPTAFPRYYGYDGLTRFRLYSN